MLDSGTGRLCIRDRFSPDQHHVPSTVVGSLTPSCRKITPLRSARGGMAFPRSLMICLVGLAAARKLPHHKATEHFHQGAPRPACAQPLVVRHSSSGRSSSSTSPALADCWVPDYCEPEKFQYKLCRLRLRGRAKPGNQYACAEDEYCEEVTHRPQPPPPPQPLPHPSRQSAVASSSLSRRCGSSAPCCQPSPDRLREQVLAASELHLPCRRASRRPDGVQAVKQTMQISQPR